MGMNLKLASSPLGTKNIGLGGGSNLRSRNLFTADDMHIDGLYWVRPYDMLNDFGAEGSAIAAAKGRRYAFFISSDHWDSSFGWARGGGIWCAWGDDPGNYPQASEFRMVAPCSVVVDGFTFTQMETPYLVYNPDDLPANPFHLYGHGSNTNGLGQRTCVFRSAEMDNWTVVTTSTHQNEPGWAGHTGYQQISRVGVNDWVSYGLANTNSIAGNRTARWTSANGLSFTIDPSNSTLDTRVDKSDFSISDGVVVIIGAQQYRITKEDAYDLTLVANPNGTPGATRLGQYVSAVPIGANGAVFTNNPNDIIRISDRYAGDYPNLSYFQSISGYAEDGIAHIWATHGFFSDVGLGAENQGASYADGGGMDDEFVDYYTYIFNATLAASAAPVGVRVSCVNGVVTLQWYDALPHQNFRVYWDEDPAFVSATLVGDVTGLSVSFSPTPSSVIYCKVFTLNGGEQGSRVVSTYVS